MESSVTVLCAMVGWLAVMPPAGPRLTIRLVNWDGVPAETLGRAEAIASWAFSRAGFDVDWLHCRPGLSDNPCQPPPGRSELWLQVLHRRPADLKGETAGYAIVYRSPDGGLDGYAAVSYPHVLSAAADCAQPIAVMLGAAMAHEIGHLLLGGNAHSAHGVMARRIGCEQLRQASRGELSFDRREAGRIRRELAVRNRR